MVPNKSHGFWELVKTIVYAVLIAIAVRTLLFEPFSIPSGSMIPTLLVGDYLFVSKYSYGYSRFSLPFGLPLFSGRVLASPPERGDVVVFKLPTDNSTDYIKRVIGLPGDRVQLRSGIVYINGEPVRRQPLGQYVLGDGSAVPHTFQLYKEILPNGRAHEIIEISDNGPFDNTGVYTVPEGHYFLMGDNRDSSRDSRFLNEVGYVPFENLIGKAQIIFFSVSGDALKFWQWYRTVRFGRLFQGVE
jgi:signal peptidase I